MLAWCVGCVVGFVAVFGCLVGCGGLGVCCLVGVFVVGVFVVSGGDVARVGSSAAAAAVAVCLLLVLFGCWCVCFSVCWFRFCFWFVRGFWLLCWCSDLVL